MSDISTRSNKRFPLTPQCSKAKPSHTVRALKTLNAAFQMSKARQKLLHQMIFARVTAPQAGWKDYVAYRRLLESDDALFILAEIWKESIPQEELCEAGLSRSFPDAPMTQHGLAVALAELPREVSAMNSQVRNLSIAAEAYGLVIRQTVTPTKVVVAATGLLHSFMLKLDHMYGRILGDLPPFAQAIDDNFTSEAGE